MSIIYKLINNRTSIIQHLYRETVKSETIVKSFKRCGISNALNGNEDNILYEESNASSENNQEDILVTVKMIFWVSMMNKLYYVC